MPVVDASVLVEYLAAGEHREEARERLLRDDEPLWAPHLLDAEVGHVLRRAVRLGELRPITAAAALVDLAEMPLHRAAHTGFMERAWSLRANLTFYDALYVALAERLDMVLLTFDARLQGAPRLRHRIELIGGAR